MNDSNTLQAPVNLSHTHTVNPVSHKNRVPVSIICHAMPLLIQWTWQGWLIDPDYIQLNYLESNEDLEGGAGVLFFI